MKPTFALDLSRDAIALLHRTPKGWLTIGEVAFDAPDMAEALDYLRKTALGLSPLGLACKVILPNSQVLYSEIHAPGPSREDKRRQIALALQGRTPYAVEDLVFDWSGKGTVVRVAVAARETLEEAEAFAVAYRLNPVSFVAVPEEDTFFGEAWFGPSNSIDTILAPGETVERDREAVTILARDVSAPPSVDPLVEQPNDGLALPGLTKALSAEVTEADLAAVAPTAASDLPVEEFDPIEPIEDPAEELAAALAPLEIEGPAAAPVASEAITDAAQAADMEAPAEPTLAEPLAEALELPLPDPIVAPVEAAPSAPLADEAPFADVTDDIDAPEFAPADRVSNDTFRSDGGTGDARVLATDILDDELPPAPSAAAMFAFSSRRSAAPVVTSGRAQPPVTAGKDKGAIARPVPPASPSAIPAKAKFTQGAVTAPSIPGQSQKPKPRADSGGIARPIPPGPVTVKPNAVARPTFGAPQGKPRRTGFVFMVMIGLLLLSLALVAAWAQFFLTQAGTDTGTVAPTAVAGDPSVEDEMAADMQDPAELAATEAELTDPALVGTEAEDLAALAVEEMPVNIGGDASGPEPTTSVDEALAATALTGDPAAGSDTEIAGLAEAAGETAPGTEIATDVSSSRTPVEDKDEIFLASMEAPPPILDALALPTPAATNDTPPDAPMPPPAFGTVYQFNEQGLLVPTPEGILSPEGIMLFAGAPPLVPPARSPAAEAAAAAAAPPSTPPAAVETTAEAAAPTAADASLVTAGETATAAAAVEAPVEPVVSDPALAGFRPKPRPASLVKPDDGASLEATSDSEYAAVHPVARPASLTEAAASTGASVADLGAQGASLEAQAEARLAEAAALEAANPSIVAISMRPMPRPSDLSRAVEDAVAAAVMEPDPNAGTEVELAAAAPDARPEEIDEMAQPETDGSSTKIPTKANVAKEATYANVLNLSKINLIGTYGTASSPYALVRQANGKYKKVEVGDRVDGGVVMAITDTELRYQKGGKLVTLKMPKA